MRASVLSSWTGYRGLTYRNALPQRIRLRERPPDCTYRRPASADDSSRIGRKTRSRILASPCPQFSDIDRCARSPNRGSEYISSCEAFTIMKIDITSRPALNRSCR
jgi:hypothetical protein